MVSDGLNIYDCTLQINEFGNPKILSEIEVVRNALLFVLYTKPGQYPSIPHLGLNIESILYNHYDELDESELRNLIVEQCSMLGAYFQNTTISIKKMKYRGNGSLLINIQGIEVYPSNYITNKNGNSSQYLIGVTLDDLGNMIHSINKK